MEAAELPKNELVLTSATHYVSKLLQKIFKGADHEQAEKEKSVREDKLNKKQTRATTRDSKNNEALNLFY